MHRDAEAIRLFQHACGLDVWSRHALEEAFHIPGTYLWDTQKSFLFFRNIHDEVEIFGIGTLPIFRLQGHGSTLVNRLKDFCCGSDSKKIFLEVSVSNESAVNFYHKHGFIEINRRKNYYGSFTSFPGDALILCWER